MLSASTIRINTKAAPHACACTSGDGCREFKNMRRGSASIGWLNPWKKYVLPMIVSSIGAVSPAIRAIARSAPVINPWRAAGKTTRRVVIHRCAPKASDASRTEVGTSLSDSSVVLATMGIIMNERATAPASGEKVPVTPITIMLKAVIPTTMDGISVSISLTVRMVDAYLLFPNSAR